jgi:hypothetical protein
VATQLHPRPRLGVRVDPDTHWLPSAMTEFAISGGVDHRGTVGTVAPGLLAQEGRCWRMIYENPVGHGTQCMQPVRRVGLGRRPTQGRRGMSVALADHLIQRSVRLWLCQAVYSVVTWYFAGTFPGRREN